MGNKKPVNANFVRSLYIVYTLQLGAIGTLRSLVVGSPTDSPKG